MPDRDEPMKPEADLPDMIDEGANPGWRVRVGVSREEVMILAEAAESGSWFETEADMTAYVQRQLNLQRRDERGGQLASTALSRKPRKHEQQEPV